MEGTVDGIGEAARRICAVSVRLAGDAIRRLGFVRDSSVDSDGRRHLALEPFGGPDATGQLAVVDFELDGRELMLVGTIAAHSNGRADIIVKKGPEARPSRARRALPRGRTAIALFVPDGLGVGRVCANLLDLNRRMLRVQLTMPLPTGTVLRRLRVLVGADLVRGGEGVVARSTPVLRADGTTAYDAAIRLRAPTADEEPAAEVHEITDATRVRAILWALCDLEYAVTLRAGNRVAHGRLQPVRGPRGAMPDVRVELDDTTAVDGTVQVECALFGSGYRFFARVRTQTGRFAHLMVAPVVRESHQRNEERLPVAGDTGARARFVHPIDGRVHDRPLVDLSANGFSFEREDGEDIFWPDLPLTQIELRFGGRRIRVPEARVRTVSDRRCGVQLAHLTPRQADRLRSEVVRLQAAPAELADPDDLDEILSFHNEVKLLEPGMQRNLDATLAEAHHGWRAAHSHAEGLMRTAVGRLRGRIASSLTLVRAYERAFVMQHSAALSPAVPANPGVLHSLLVRMTIPRPDAEYILGFIAEDAKAHHSVMAAFFAECSTPDHRGATPFGLWAVPAAPSAPAGPRLRRLGSDDEQLIENAALLNLDAVSARGLGFMRGNTWLRDTTRSYARAGLERSRDLWAAEDDRGQPTAVMSREWASPGLALSSLLSAAILMPLADDAGGIAELVRLLATRPMPGAPVMRHLFAPANQPSTAAALEAAGMRFVSGCTLYTMHRVGLQEYQRYISARYGFLHGRLRARRPERA